MDDKPHHLSVQTRAVQAFGGSGSVDTALVAPVHMSTTFLRDADNGYASGHVYGRTDNVSVQQTERLLASLEGAEEALLFSSGMAAATSLFLALPRADPRHRFTGDVLGFSRLAARERPAWSSHQFRGDVGSRRRACGGASR